MQVLRAYMAEQDSSILFFDQHPRRSCRGRRTSATCRARRSGRLRRGEMDDLTEEFFAVCGTNDDLPPIQTA